LGANYGLYFLDFSANFIGCAKQSFNGFLQRVIVLVHGVFSYRLKLAVVSGFGSICGGGSGGRVSPVRLKGISASGISWN